MYNGNLVVMAFVNKEESTPGAKLMIDLQKKYNKGVVNWGRWEEYAWGFHTVYVTLAAIEKALQKIPGNKLTGADVKKYGLDTLNIDTQGLSMGASYTDYPGKRNATIGAKLYEMRDAKLVPKTDWIKFVYQSPFSPTAPDWVKEVQREVLEKEKEKK